MKGIFTMIVSALVSSVTASAQTTDSNSYKNNITTPVRIGILPGLGTPGKNDSRTTSQFSFNLLGGRTGSIQGVEVSGLFNIDIGNVQYVQTAGLFNTVGKHVKGVQVAGLYNTVRGTLTGTQAGGIANYVKASITGIQVAGIHNHTSAKLTGLQAAGISNYARENAQGIQVAGIANVSTRGIAGVQIGGIVNYAKRVKGAQIGLINIADTSDGVSIGLINIVRTGYNKISIFTNEVLNFNVALKTGSRRLYSIFLAGINPSSNNKAFTYGYGLGTELQLGNRFSVNPEATCQYLYLGNKRNTNLLNKMSLQANMKIVKGLTVFAGPSFAVYYSNQEYGISGYKYRLPYNSYNSFDLGSDKVSGWIGWNVGLTFF
jgi:hypothetical protein